MFLLAGGERYLVHWVTDGINLVVVNEVKNQQHNSSRLRAGLPVAIVTVMNARLRTSDEGLLG
jgi:hypothetical protein